MPRYIYNFYSVKLPLGLTAILVFAVVMGALPVLAQLDGTGWTPVTPTFRIQSPTNAPQSERYWFTNDIYHCLVYSTDGAFSVGNTTKPRTEQRFTPDYTSGEIQYQADMMAPADENSYCIFQIHTGDAQSPTYGSTTFMLFWFTNDDGSVHDYSGTTLATDLGNKWFQLNVDHNLVNRTIKVWVNQKLVWTQQDNGAGDFYMKDGVYEQSHNPTYQMDAYITNILMWTRPGSPIVPLAWTGQTNGVNVGAWDLGATADWKDTANGTTQFYQDNSPVTFDDSAPGDTTVTLEASVHPASVTVSNAVRNYTFAGSGSLDETTSLIKSGGGTLTSDIANSFSGGVLINGGIFQAGNASALGSASGTTVITNDGTLDVDGNELRAGPIVVSGWGVNSNGAIINASSSPQYNALQHVTLAGDTALGGPGNWLASGNPGRWDIRGSGTTLSTDGHAFDLYKVGSNQVSIVGADVDASLANIDIRQGMLGFEDGSTSMGNPADALIVRAGGTLEFYQSSAPANSYTKQFVLYGGGATACITNWSGGGSSTIAGQMTLNGDCVIGVNGTSFTNNCIIIGSGGLIKAGAKPLVLGGINAYTGDTTVNGGVLLLQGAGSILDSATIKVVSGATLDAGGRMDGTLTLADGQTLTGNGTINGNVIISNGATLAPGGALTTLSFSNNLTLNADSKTLIEINNQSLTGDAAHVSGTVTYGGTLIITNIGPGMLVAGDHFQIFSAAEINGTFANIVPAIPGINLAWDTNNLANGVLSIASKPTPSPVLETENLTGNTLTLSGTNGVPGRTYYVLTSTNLALPLDEWVPVATNSFDGNGSFSTTNIISPNACQQYYRLQVQ
jgi:autotransporter-associated beta strand protein